MNDNHSLSHNYGTNYVVPPANSIGPHGFVLYHETALDPVEAYMPAPGPTGIMVNTECFRWWIGALHYIGSRPHIYVNGVEFPNVQWGTTHVPLAEGLYHLDVLTGEPSFLVRLLSNSRHNWARADTVVPVRAGCATPVYYRASPIRIIKAAIAPRVPNWPGMNWIRFSWVITAVLAMFIAFCVIQGVLQ